MPRRLLPLFLAAACAALALPPAAPAADWPEFFGGDARNPVSNERGLPTQFIPGTIHLDNDTNAAALKTSNLKWRVKLSTHAYSGPVIAGGKIFLGTSNTEKGGLVLALDEATGRELWRLYIPRFRTDLPLYNYDNLDLGVCSTPTVEGNRLYLVSNRDEVLCLDTEGQANGNDGPFQDEAKFVVESNQPPAADLAKIGDIVWRFDMLTEKNVEAWVQDASSCSVIVRGNYVYVNPSNGVDKSHKNVPRPHAPSIIVLDKRTGKLVARDYEEVGTRLFHGEWSSPSMGVVGSRRWLGGLGGRELLFWGAGDGRVYAFDPQPQPPLAGQPIPRLQTVWSFDVNASGGRTGVYKTVAGPSEVTAAPVLHRDRIYAEVGQDPRHGEGRGVLACIDATKTGDVTSNGMVWVNTSIDRSLTTVAIEGKLLFTADFSGRVHCLDLDTGKTHWMYESHRPIWSSPLIADGKVYIGTDAGDLLVFAESKEMKLLAKTKVESPISASPVAHKGVLYLLTQHWLFAAKEGADARPGE